MKAIFKPILNVVALILVLPALACYWLGCLLLGSQQAFAGWSQAFALIPGLTGMTLRRAFYSLALRGCGADSCVSFGTIFSHPTSSIGRSVYIGPYCMLGDVTLEDDVLISSHVSIMNGSGQHGIEKLDVPIREQPGQWPHVTIGQDSWIGDRAIIQCDVGKHCVIGSGSVVTTPIPDYAIAVGVPAKVVRFRNQQETSDGEAGQAKS